MVEDLSRRHQPVSGLLGGASASDGRPYRLGEEQVAAYGRQGFVGGVRVLDDRQVERLRIELEALFDPAHPGHELFHEYHSNESTDPATTLFHALGAWRIQPGLHDLLWNPAIVVPASQLLGGAVRFWHDQLFCKPPRHGGVVAWHQDYSYWTRTTPMAHLTCWIALDDASRDNGCLHYIPESHHWPLLPITGLAGGMDAIQTVLSPEQKAQWREVPMELPKGYATFHHPLMVHGSYGNATERPRRGVVLNFCRDGVVSDSDRPLLKGVPVVPKGQPLSGQFFPLVYDPARMS